jgi:hypothetical protein
MAEFAVHFRAGQGAQVDNAAVSLLRTPSAQVRMGLMRLSLGGPRSVGCELVHSARAFVDIC